jgi:uncharacterized lipoprotein YajG
MGAPIHGRSPASERVIGHAHPFRQEASMKLRMLTPALALLAACSAPTPTMPVAPAEGKSVKASLTEQAQATTVQVQDAIQASFASVSSPMLGGTPQ